VGKVALDCTNQMLKWTRTSESCINKFEKLAFQKKPTGTAKIPVHVAWAKQGVKENISENEMIGYIAGYDADCSSLGDSGGESGLSNPSLRGAKMIDEFGEVKIPPTKKKKSSQVSDAIRDLGTDHIMAAEKIQQAINCMVIALGPATPSVVELPAQAFAGSPEDRMQNLEEDVTEIKSSIGIILSILKSKK